MATWQMKSVGRSLREYTHVDYDELVSKFTEFVQFSQFEDDLQGVDFSKFPNYKTQDTPICGRGRVLYGISNGPERTLVKLKFIVDSSD